MTLITYLLIAAAAEPGFLTAVSSPLNDYNLSFDAAERTRVFARSEAEFRNARILISERRGGRWTKPRPIAFSDSRFSDSDPWLTADGRTLYFISDRPAPGRAEDRTDYDIWRSTRTSSGWSPPERLGPQVNSAGQELGPELHRGTLYFASARRSGAGGLDIYQARKAGSGFVQAMLVPGPFNSPSSDSDFTLSSDGRSALFWRSVEGRGVIHIAYRLGGAWSNPKPLPGSVNLGPFNFTPSFSRDGRRIRFASTRERESQAKGLADLYELPLPPR